MGSRTTFALIALLCLGAGSGAAPPPSTAGAGHDAPPAATAPAPSASVLDPAQVIDILNHTVLWYRTLGTQQQFADQPSDQLILFANRQTADQVVALAFQIARADAELYASQVSAHTTAEDASSPQALAKVRDRLLAEAQQLQAHIDAKKGKPAEKPKAGRSRKAQAAPAPSDAGDDESARLEMLKARANLLNTMLDFATQSNSETRRAAMFKAQIDAIAATIPAASGTTAVIGAAPAGASSPTASTGAAAKEAERSASGRTGLWDLGTAVWRLHTKLTTIAQLKERTHELADTYDKYQGPSRDQLLAYTKRNDELAAVADHAPADHAASGQEKDLRGKFDTLAWFFNQTSAIYIPLANEHVLLGQYVGNLDSWNKDSEEQYKDAWIALGKRLALVGGILVGIFVVGEIWRRAVLGLAHERSRLYQLLLVRRIVLWIAVITVLGLSVVTEISSFATFAGLLTAGTAVAMQSVLVSVVGYFFLIGKYGVKVGDRVQIGNVAGEVIDIGLVRMHLMEYNTNGPLGPTGRVVAFANLIVFQASGGLFKQLSGTNVTWHEMTVTLPAVRDYTALKEELLHVVMAAIEEYRPEFVGATAAVSATDPRATAGDPPQIHMRLVSGHMDAVIRYPVTANRAAEIDERVSEAVLSVLSQ